jgi:cold shock CspA family protein
MKGCIRWFDALCGDGQIACEDGSRIFFWSNDSTLAAGQLVSFDIVSDWNWRQAHNIRKVV